MEYSSLTKAHRIIMNRLFRECSHHIYEILCTDNNEALLNDMSRLLSEFTTMNHHMDKEQSMVRISPELPPSYIQLQSIFAPLVQHFTMKQLQKITKYHVGDNGSIGRDNFLCGSSDFAGLFKGRNIIPTIIYYQGYSLESTDISIKCILIPDNTMTISWGTVKFKP